MYHSFARFASVSLSSVTFESARLTGCLCVNRTRFWLVCCHHRLHAHDVSTISHQHGILPSKNCPLREKEELFVDTPMCVSNQRLTLIPCSHTKQPCTFWFCVFHLRKCTLEFDDHFQHFVHRDCSSTNRCTSHFHLP